MHRQALILKFLTFVGIGSVFFKLKYDLDYGQLISLAWGSTLLKAYIYVRRLADCPLNAGRGALRFERADSCAFTSVSQPDVALGQEKSGSLPVCHSISGISIMPSTVVRKTPDAFIRRTKVSSARASLVVDIANRRTSETTVPNYHCCIMPGAVHALVSGAACLPIDSESFRRFLGAVDASLDIGSYVFKRWRVRTTRRLCFLNCDLSPAPALTPWTKMAATRAHFSI